MSQPDHQCSKTNYLGNFRGHPQMIYEAKCRETGCSFQEVSVTEVGRAEKIRHHQKTEARRAIYRGISNAVLGNPEKIKEAMARFADISTHEYDEWTRVVDTLMEKEFNLHLADVQSDKLRGFYDVGIDALTAVGNLINTRPVRTLN